MLINVTSNEGSVAVYLGCFAHQCPTLRLPCAVEEQKLSENLYYTCHVTQHCPSLFEHFTASGLPPKNVIEDQS